MIKGTRFLCPSHTDTPKQVFTRPVCCTLSRWMMLQEKCSIQIHTRMYWICVLAVRKPISERRAEGDLLKKTQQNNQLSCYPRKIIKNLCNYDVYIARKKNQPRELFWLVKWKWRLQMPKLPCKQSNCVCHLAVLFHLHSSTSQSPCQKLSQTYP